MAIRTAIIGYGRNGSTMHADPIEKLPQFELTAVCDIDPEALKKARERFNCRCYEDYRQLLAQEELDLAVIVTRSFQHADMAADCLLAGKNVLVTKPWALNIEETLKMTSAANKSGKLLMPWLPARWGSDLKKVRELVEAGAIGKVFHVRRSEYTFGIRGDWQIEKKYGGGYLLNWGPHLIDQPLQLVGQPVKQVYGEMKQIINPGDVEDVFYAVIKTEGGVTITSEYTIIAPGMANWIIQGSKGTIYVRGNEVELQSVEHPDPVSETGYRGRVVIDKSMVTVKGDIYGDNFEVYSHIADVVNGVEPYAITLESAQNLTRVLDAVRLSAETGEVVKL